MEEKDLGELFDHVEKFTLETLQKSLNVLEVKTDEKADKEELLVIFKKSLSDSFISSLVQKHRVFWVGKRKRGVEDSEEEKKKKEEKLDGVIKSLKKEGVEGYFKKREDEFKGIVKRMDLDDFTKTEKIRMIKDTMIVDGTESFLKKCPEEVLDSYITDLNIVESRKKEKYDKILTFLFELE